jgi:hypothetical protein
MQTLAVLQSSPGLPASPGCPGHKAFEYRPLGKWYSIYHHLSLIVSGLEDTLHKLILHRAVMLAYAFHDLWPFATTVIFSFLAKVWHERLLCAYFFLRPFIPRIGSCLVQLSQADQGFLEQVANGWIKLVIEWPGLVVPHPPECAVSGLTINCHQHHRFMTCPLCAGGLHPGVWHSAHVQQGHRLLSQQTSVRFGLHTGLSACHSTQPCASRSRENEINFSSALAICWREQMLAHPGRQVPYLLRASAVRVSIHLTCLLVLWPVTESFWTSVYVSTKWDQWHCPYRVVLGLAQCRKHFFMLLSKVFQSLCFSHRRKCAEIKWKDYGTKLSWVWF